MPKQKQWSSRDKTIAFFAICAIAILIGFNTHNNWIFDLGLIGVAAYIYILWKREQRKHDPNNLYVIKRVCPNCHHTNDFPYLKGEPAEAVTVVCRQCGRPYSRGSYAE